ncbi:hypothetical protein HK100_009845 [Physocladia obscura]|uniref:Zinc finger PHD-type domain-containing protein n=1 Tax=Physocladia obscura TaxID=109957 RepID=A0AAD5TAL8_9FUNG|nr:hypothetical protein HK100_009845 [Physocladia obscura]
MLDINNDNSDETNNMEDIHELSDGSLTPLPSDSSSALSSPSSSPKSAARISMEARKPQEQTKPIELSPLAILRSNWRFAACTQFLTMFANAVDFPFSDTEVNPIITGGFEDALLTEPPPADLINLHVKLLRIITYNRFVTPESWPSWFLKECSKRNIPESMMSVFPMTPEEYSNNSFMTRVLILHTLCEFMFDSPERFRERVSPADTEECRTWRVDPVGKDSKGYIYWLFDDNRLYRELVQTKTGEISDNVKWELVCRTADDWQTFPATFKTSRSPNDRALHQMLTLGIGVTVLQSLHDRVLEEARIAAQQEQLRRRVEEEAARVEREYTVQAEREMAIMSRKRSSRLENKLLEQMERERTEMIERDARRGVGESVDKYESHFRITRGNSSVSQSRKNQQTEPISRDERFKRRLQRSGLDDSTENEVDGTDNKDGELKIKIAESIETATASRESADIDIKGDTANPVFHQLQELASKRIRIGIAATASSPATASISNSYNSNNRVKGKGRKSVTKKSGGGGGRIREGWIFNCSCGKNAKNWDDGLPMISCGRCNVWQHIYCIEMESGNMAPGALNLKKWNSQEFTCKQCRSGVDQVVDNANGVVVFSNGAPNGFCSDSPDLINSQLLHGSSAAQQFAPFTHEVAGPASLSTLV